MLRREKNPPKNQQIPQLSGTRNEDHCCQPSPTLSCSSHVVRMHVLANCWKWTRQPTAIREAVSGLKKTFAEYLRKYYQFNLTDRNQTAEISRHLAIALLPLFVKKWNCVVLFHGQSTNLSEEVILPQVMKKQAWFSSHFITLNVFFFFLNNSTGIKSHEHIVWTLGIYLQQD